MKTDFVTRDVADDFVSVNGERDDSDFAWQIYGGYRLLKYFALEARYTDFGSYEAALRGQVVGFDIDGNSTVEIVAVSAHAIGIYPFGGQRC